LYSIAIRSDMCQPKPEGRERETAWLRQWTDVAEKLGATHIRVFGGTVPKGSTEEEAAGWVVETLKQASEYAGSKGVILGLENHGGITERASRVLEIVRRVDSPWVGVNLDSGNFREQVWEQIEMLAPLAVNTQVKAEMRGEGGTRGPGDWERLLALLARTGYKGYLSLEYEAKEPPETAVPRLCRRLRELAGKYSVG